MVYIKQVFMKACGKVSKKPSTTCKMCSVFHFGAIHLEGFTGRIRRGSVSFVKQRLSLHYSGV